MDLLRRNDAQELVHLRPQSHIVLGWLSPLSELQLPSPRFSVSERADGRLSGRRGRRDSPLVVNGTDGFVTSGVPGFKAQACRIPRGARASRPPSLTRHPPPRTLLLLSKQGFLWWVYAVQARAQDGGHLTSPFSRGFPGDSQALSPPPALSLHLVPSDTSPACVASVGKEGHR